MANGPIFPAFLKIEHQADASAKASFLAEVASFTTDAKRQFERDFGEIRGIIDKSLTGFKQGNISLSLDLPGLRQTAAEADNAVQKLRLMRDAATSLAASTGDTSKKTQTYLAALRAQVIEAERAQRAADAQVTTYSRLQGELDKQISGNKRLADSYRALYAEEAAAANFAYRSQQAVNAGFAPGLNRQVKSARDSASVFENTGYKPTVDMRSGLDRLRDGSASLDRAAVSATTLEQALGRVAAKGPEVSAALQQARKAEDDLARATAALRGELDPTVAAQQRMASQTQLLDRALKQGAIDATEHARLQKLVGEQYELNALAAQRSVGAQRAMRQAMLQSGQQLQDIAISLYSGQQASVVFAQQLPQLAFAFTGLEGSANKTQARIGRLANFLSGPWGLAVGLAVGVVGTLISEMLGLGDETEKTEKKSRSFIEVLNDSKSSWEEVAKAARDYADQQEKNRQVTLASIATEAAATAERLKSAIAIREQLKADLEAYESITRRGAQSESQDVVRQGAFARADRTRQAITENQKSLDALTAAAGEVVIKAADTIAKIQSDPTAKITAGFDVLRDSARKTIKDVDALAARLAELNRQEAAALKAARDATRASSSANRQYGREIDVDQARSIAVGAGLRVTSGLRSRAEQQRLYDTVRTPQNPVALPGTSAHERGNALDIAFGAGVSPASIRKAFQDEGVRLTKILKETGHYHIEWSTSGADKAVREAQQVEDYGKRAAESIARITERFDAQPRAIDQATQATRQLDDITKELGERNLLNPDAVAQIEKARAAIADFKQRPFDDFERETNRQLQVQGLVLSGREREADVLQETWRIAESIGFETKDQVRFVRDVVEARYDEMQAMERIRDVQSAYLDATRSVRQEVEAILSGQGKFSNFKTIFRNLQGRVLTEQIFGDVFRDLDTWVKKNTGLGRATDEFTQSTEKAGDALERLSKRVDAINMPTGTVTGGTRAAAANDNQSLQNAFDAQFGAPLGPNGEIIVTGRRPVLSPEQKKAAKLAIEVPKGTVLAMSPQSYFDEMSNRLGVRLAEALNSTFGTGFFSRFQGVISGAFSGSATGGIPGGIIGAIKGIDGLPKEFSKVLGKAGEGAATGTAAAGIMKALGIKTSTTGAQIGGAIGSALPIPGGQIIGSILGGLVGGLFKKTKYGSATIGNLDGVLGVTGTTGNSGQYIKAAGENADSILSGIDRIAQALGATVNASAGAVSIGYYKGKVRVDPTGAGRTKSQVDFGKDGLAEAIQYATLDLIKDGVLTGLRQGTQTLLKNAKDLDSGLQKAVDFEGVFAQLKAIKDPVGAALDALDKEFGRLQTVFKEASASTEEYASLEELYAIKRKDAIEKANEQMLSSLKSLLSDLNTGDNGLSLRDRETAARAAYDPLAARLRAGDTTAFDDFTAAARSLLEIERQIYGSQAGYFNFFNEVKALSQSAVDTQTAIATASANRDDPFSKAPLTGTDNAGIISAIDNQTSTLASELKAANDNLIAILQKMSAAGISPATGINFGATF